MQKLRKFNKKSCKDGLHIQLLEEDFFCSTIIKDGARKCTQCVYRQAIGRVYAAFGVHNILVDSGLAKGKVIFTDGENISRRVIIPPEAQKAIKSFDRDPTNFDPYSIPPAFFPWDDDHKPRSRERPTDKRQARAQELRNLRCYNWVTLDKYERLELNGTLTEEETAKLIELREWASRRKRPEKYKSPYRVQRALVMVEEEA